MLKIKADVLPLRLDLGSGRYPAEGFRSVDLHQKAHYCLDFTEAMFFNVNEVRMCHVLEHFGWRDTVPVLEHVRSWMIAGGKLTVEVPDMERIMMGATHNPDWIRYVYGSQEHKGEFHRTGFTGKTLWKALKDAGWYVERINMFPSSFRTRVGMPCIEAKASACG